MKQLVSPNLTVQGKAGWCLSVQQDVWGTPHIYNTAQDAWNAAQFKHTELPPNDVYSLCYWTYRDPSDGINYWHVATHAPDGRIYTSPFNVSFGSEWYSSIDAMTARIRKIDPSSQYVGWVEDLSNVRLIKEQDMVTSEDCYIAFNNARMRPPSQDELDMFVDKWELSALNKALNSGTERETVVSEWMTGKQAMTDNWSQQISDSNKRNSDLGKSVTIKDDEIKKLTAQLAVQSNDTELLNGFGAWLTKIIVRLGLKG